MRRLIARLSLPSTVCRCDPRVGAIASCRLRCRGRNRYRALYVGVCAATSAVPSGLTQRRVSRGRRRAGDLGDELAGYRFREGVEIFDLQQKGAGPANDVLFEVFRQPAGRLGVKGIARVGLGIDDRETVDRDPRGNSLVARLGHRTAGIRSEEHTSELQSHSDLVCRLLLEKKKKKINTHTT